MFLFNLKDTVKRFLIQSVANISKINIQTFYHINHPVYIIYFPFNMLKYSYIKFFRSTQNIILIYKVLAWYFNIRL